MTDLTAPRPSRWYRGVTLADRRAWAAAAGLGDLGELVAQWLEGRLGSRPGYLPNRGPDPETAPLVPILAALNRAGLVTTTSQPGRRRVGDRHEQRAALVGYCHPDLHAALAGPARDAGLFVLAQDLAGRLEPKPVTPISRYDGRVVTRVALPSSRSHARAAWHGAALQDSARAALEGAHIVAVIDPEWGREDRLWSVLSAVVAPACVPVARARPDGDSAAPGLNSRD